MVALSLHEGEPGHHLQSMDAINQKGVPKFRQYIEDMKYSRSPAKFSMHTGYVEVRLNLFSPKYLEWYSP